MNRLKLNNDVFEPFITEDQIRQKVHELAARINADYQGKVPIFIGVLNGAFMFLADLIREVTVDCEVDFLKLSSYGDAKISSGQVKMLKKLDCQVTGRDIVIVEDIVDSGLSVAFVRELVMHENPKSIRFVSLLLKKGLPKIDFPIEYVGFEIPPDFVVGYGLDYQQKVRNLKTIYRLVSDGQNSGR
jgi:hypoxanthine phosphoribosyltransferase